MKRVLIIGDREFIVNAMDSTAALGPGLSVLGLIDSAMDIVEDVRQARPDVIILDGVDDDGPAMRCLPEIRASAPNALVVLVAGEIGRDHLVRARAAGTILCSLPSLRPARSSPDGAAREALTGDGADLTAPPAEAKLTTREREILEWVVSGHTNAWIARQLWVTEQTVKFHLTNTYRKLGVSNRTEASRQAAELGLLSRPGGQPPGDTRDPAAGPVAERVGQR